MQVTELLPQRERMAKVVGSRLQVALASRDPPEQVPCGSLIDLIADRHLNTYASQSEFRLRQDPREDDAEYEPKDKQHGVLRCVDATP